MASIIASVVAFALTSLLLIVAVNHDRIPTIAALRGRGLAIVHENPFILIGVDDHARSTLPYSAIFLLLTNNSKNWAGCTTFLIRERTFLTAKHCFYGAPTSDEPVVDCFYQGCSAKGYAWIVDDLGNKYTIRNVVTTYGKDSEHSGWALVFVDEYTHRMPIEVVYASLESDGTRIRIPGIRPLKFANAHEAPIKYDDNCQFVRRYKPENPISKRLHNSNTEPKFSGAPVLVKDLTTEVWHAIGIHSGHVGSEALNKYYDIPQAVSTLSETGVDRLLPNCQQDSGSDYLVLPTLRFCAINTRDDPIQLTNKGLVKRGCCAADGSRASWADVNGDGNSDLVCDATNGYHHVLLSDGNGGFIGGGIVANTNFCEGPSTTIWADVNGDGKADMTCHHHDDGRHEVWLSQGDGTFNDDALYTASVVNTQYCSGTSRAFWADVNGDGKADLLCSSTTGRHYRSLNIGPRKTVVMRTSVEAKHGWCAAAGSRASWADVNGDGYADLLCDATNGYHHVLLSDGNGGFIGGSIVANENFCEGPSTTIWADVNGDGKADMTCHNHDGRHEVWLSQGDGTFNDHALYTESVVNTQYCSGTSRAFWADINGDGKADLLCSTADGKHYRSLNGGTTQNVVMGTPVEVKSNWCTAVGSRASWADVNGDGNADLLCDATNGYHHVLLSDGLGGFIRDPTGDNTGDEIVANTDFCKGSSTTNWVDVDGDGKVDMTCHNHSDGTHQVWLSQGDGRFNNTALYTESAINGRYCSGTSKAFWADINGDGIADLLCSSEDGRHYRSLNERIKLGVITESPVEVKRNWCAVDGSRASWADVNGDGYSDLLCDATNGYHHVLLSNGLGGFMSDPTGDNTGDEIVANTNFCGGPSTTIWADVNGDGKADMTCHINGGYQEVWLSIGDGTFENLAYRFPRDYWQPDGVNSWCKGTSSRLSWVDVDNNGMADLVCDDVNGDHHMILISFGSLPTSDIERFGYDLYTVEDQVPRFIYHSGKCANGPEISTHSSVQACSQLCAANPLCYAFNAKPSQGYCSLKGPGFSDGACSDGELSFEKSTEPTMEPTALTTTAPPFLEGYQGGDCIRF